MRLIDADALIAEIKPYVDNTCKFLKPKELIQYIYDLPTIDAEPDDSTIQKMQDLEQAQLDKAYELGREDAQPQWIPCSERLPEESDGTVLVCMPDVFPYNCTEPYINAKHNKQVCTATYSQYSKRWYYGEMNAVGKDDPIAWMPRPEPYKGGEQNED